MSAITRIRPNEIRQAQRFVVPERSLEQCMEALRLANVIRAFRANWKKEVKLGQREILEPLHTIAEAEEDAETLWDTMKVLDYLLGIPKVGRTKANKVLTQTRISPSKTLGGLTSRQREELEVQLRVWMGSLEQRSEEYHRALVREIAEARR
jgi:hypothetical protein